MSEQTSPENTAPSVLVVDDNAMSRKVIQYRLDKDGYTVAIAGSGEEALKIIESETVGLIFLDMIMEGMSGLEVLAALKADARFKDIPVVVVSGADDPAASEMCLAAGASDFMHKPVRASSLREISLDLMGPAGAADGEAEQTAAINIADLPILDQTFISQMSSDYGKETTAGFVSRFQDLAPGQIDAIMAAADTTDTKELRRIVIGLKGGARALGLTRLAGACREIERAHSQGQHDEAKSTINGLGENLTAALSALNEHATAL